ncbi:butyrophilin subfamily 1 member A1-like isoform X2 [Nycticebus coucang]|nr:butyrophilin subfamily 1 member A1-like isoform X2 [Nycticebus coucang]XP_053459471.1 butyrophilin subfamily 1 member A1-like isoform X2 [Nycticebus coucang]XP_053459472.1 butyrophilin subfamily 1 member A1-like isoform X2 [Nycticebus coucang]XP_053459473.1 butyrophilin subfamily 1 member A1-like isoform X2 [Nycticebus coucang]
MENCSSSSLFCCLTSVLLLTRLPTCVSADKFLVMGPLDPIVAVLGGNAMLPCFLSPAMNAESMELRWFRSKFSDVVFVYRNRQEQNKEQMAQYAGRTSLVSDFLTQGKAAVQIHKVQASDHGLYTCFFKKGAFYEEATLELKVAGVGSAPEVRIDGPEDDGIRVVCTASGWFPKPQVQWRHLSGEKFLAFSEAHAQDAEELFSVEATLVVRDSSAGNVTCSILNPLLGLEKVAAIFLPEAFFPQASPWKSVFAVSMVMLGLLLFGAAYFITREYFTKLQEQEERESLRRAKEEDQKAKEETLEAVGQLQEELDKRKKAYRVAWRKAQLYADWRTEKFQAWSVTLNPGSAHSNLAISHDKKTLTWKDTSGSSSECFSVLGLEGITSGRVYWEVEVENGDSNQWTLGVCREDVKRTDWYKESPDKGFWVMGRFDVGYCACTKPDTQLCLQRVPHRVGVFLDYSEGDASFFNMNDGSHIFSFPPASFSGTLFPYFMLRSGDLSMTICSVVGGPEGLPASHNNSSLEELKSSPGERFISGSGVGGIPPEVESPLLPFIPETVAS